MSFGAKIIQPVEIFACSFAYAWVGEWERERSHIRWVDCGFSVAEADKSFGVGFDA
jgi:hypothetical protein